MNSTSQMTHKTTSSDDKLTCTDYVDFGDYWTRYGRISWSQIEKDGTNTKYLQIQVKVIKKDQHGEFRVHQKLNMGELDFKAFLTLRNQLYNAATHFAKEQDLKPITDSLLDENEGWKEMETRLKMVHKVFKVVDLEQRKICVTMLRYKLKQLDTSYIQIRLFWRKQGEEKFQQIVYVNYKVDEFIELLDIMHSVRDKILNNQSLQIPAFIDEEEEMTDTTLECKRPTQTTQLKRSFEHAFDKRM